MVREWGMSDKIGPMAWGSQGQVFLGEDLMHTRDYSEHTSQVIDDEVELILRAQEQRALEVLARHRGGLDAVARALLDEETIDGETVGRLVDTAYGKPVHAHGVKTVPPIFVAAQHGPTGSDDVDGPPEDADDAAGASTGATALEVSGNGADAPAVPAENGVAGASHATDQSGATQGADSPSTAVATTSASSRRTLAPGTLAPSGPTGAGPLAEAVPLATSAAAGFPLTG
jgi:hypothetical protein